jgi:membrane-associated phospholipid phosphatase
MNISFNRFFLQNLIVAERWNSFSINDQKFLDEHRFEIEEIFNVENQNVIFEIFSINSSNFDLILEWRLL